MGSSFTNIHVNIGARDPALISDQVSTGIVDWLEERGFGKIDDPTEADRTVAFGLDPGGRWINVYDETTDIYGDHQALGSLAQELAVRTGTPVIASHVFDSSLAWLALFDSQGPVAELVHGEEMDDSGQFVASMARNFDRWSALLLGDANTDDLERTWVAPTDDDAGSYISADDRVVDACGLLGIDPVRVSTGYGHLDFLPSEAVLSHISFQIVDEAKASESIGIAAGTRVPEGLFLSGPDSLDLTDGARFELRLSVANLGPEPIEGILLWAQGSALDSGLVRLDRAKSIALSAPPQGFGRATASFAAARDSGADVAAALGDFRIGGWPPDPTSMATYAATFQAQAGIDASGVALKAGSGSLVFAVFPRAQVDAGEGPEAQGIEVKVTVR